MNAQPKLTSADLNRGAAAAAQELNEARAEHAKKAYDHALDRNNEVARQALIKSKQRIELLEAELQGLSAATDEAKRRERLADLDAQIAEWQQLAAQGCSAADEAGKAFAKVERAVAALGKAVKELEIVEQKSNEIEARCAKSAVGYYTCSITTHGQIENLLQFAIGPCRHEAYDAEVYRRPAAAVEEYCEQAKQQIRSGANAKIAALQQEAAKLA